MKFETKSNGESLQDMESERRLRKKAEKLNGMRSTNLDTQIKDYC